MSKPKSVSLFDIKIRQDKKQKLKDLAIKERRTPGELLEHVIDNLYETFYVGNKDLFKRV